MGRSIEQGNRRVIAIRYLINLGGLGEEEEEDLSEAVQLNCFPLHCFSLRLSHARRRAKHIGDDQDFVVLYSTCPSSQLGCFCVIHPLVPQALLRSCFLYLGMTQSEG